MCGIVGYVGKEQAAPILLDGLRRLEYRGKIIKPHRQRRFEITRCVAGRTSYKQ